MNARRWTILGLLAAFAFGTWIRFAGIASLSLWYDEGFTAWAVDHPPTEIIRIIRNDTAPPLYYLLLHGWTLAFGRSETGLRSLSAVLGVATIPLIAAIANLTLKKPAAVVAATWLFALSFAQIWYSQEARAYELTAFWMALMLLSLLRHIQRPSQINLVLLTLSVIGAAYTHNIMLLYIAAVGAAGLAFPSPVNLRRKLRDMTIVTFCLIASYLPWIGALRSQVHRVNSNFWLPPPTFNSVCALLARICGVAHYWAWDRFIHVLYRDTAVGLPHTVVAALLLGLVLIVMRLRGNDRRTAIALAIATLGAPLAAIIESVINRPILLPAAVLPSTVVFPVLAAGALVWTTHRKSRMLARAFVAIILLATAATLGGYEIERTKEDWRGAAATVAAMPPAAARWIIFVDNDSEHPFDYYYQTRPNEVEKWIGPNDLAELRNKLASGLLNDVVLINAHAGWIDPGGDLHAGFSDPDALITRTILSYMQIAERIDLPADPSRHEITIYHCVRRD